jgi:hypothetical protein
VDGAWYRRARRGATAAAFGGEMKKGPRNKPRPLSILDFYVLCRRGKSAPENERDYFVDSCWM